MEKGSLLSQIEFHQETGSLLFKDVRYMLIRPETLSALQKWIEKELGPRGADLIYESGFTGGRLSAERYRELFSLSLFGTGALLHARNGRTDRLGEVYPGTI